MSGETNSAALPANGAGTVSLPGFAWYGKLPSAGDFISRRMPYPLQQYWDRLCASGMESLRAGSNASGWEVWRGCAKWAFILPAQPGIPLSQIGVWAPSCDRVGRNFPFLVTLPLPNDRVTAFLPYAAMLGLAWGEVIAQAQMARHSIDEVDSRLQQALAEVLASPASAEDSERTLPQGMNPASLPWSDLASSFAGGDSESYWWSVPPAMTRFRARAHSGTLQGMFFLGLCEA
jgi:type VI secretion system protein ImpM